MKTLTLIVFLVSAITITALGQKNPSTIEGKQKLQTRQASSVEPEKSAMDVTDAALGRVVHQQIPDRPMRILHKPRAPYPADFCIQGTVILRVTFLETGEIGTISVVKGLPHCTERAIYAARRIEFEPAIVGGKPVTVTKQIEYSFSIY